jgi:hypothetical protein
MSKPISFDDWMSVEEELDRGSEGCRAWREAYNIDTEVTK